ncbi:MAG: NAD(P)-dependent oxidoreductase [candidate division WOR-3 bacterium]
MKALVTGANGFIGSHLCEYLIELGHSVRGMVRRTSNLRWLAQVLSRMDLVYGDLRDSDSLRRAVDGIEVVFHLGANVRDTRDFEEVNCNGTRLLAQACVDAQVRRFVLFSSAAAGGPALSPEEPRCEAHPPEPVSRYGRGKLAAENAVLALSHQLCSVILRLPAVYGPRDQDLITLLRWARRGFVPVFGGTFSTIYVGDAVRAAVLAAERNVPSGAVYYVTDGQCYTFNDMAGVLASVFGRRPILVRLPRWFVHAAAWLSEKTARNGSIFNPDKARELTQQCWVASSDKARTELGFVPEYDLKTGMCKTIQWYEEMNWL